MRELKGTDFAYLKARMAHNRNYAAGFGLEGVVLFVIAMATTAVLALVALALWIVAFGSFSRSTHYLKGMRGEMKVAQALRGLDDSWCCFHDVLFQQGGGTSTTSLSAPRASLLWRPRITPARSGAKGTTGT